MKRPQLVSKGALSRMMQAATDSWHRQDYQQYFEVMERASRLDPANHCLLLDLGRAYGMRYDYTASERCLEKAVRVAPQKPDALTMAALHCRDFGRYEMAQRFLERATQQPEAAPETFVKLAEIYERLRRLDEANALVDRALHQDGACAFALLARARLARGAGRLDEAADVLRSFVTKSEPQTWSIRIRGWYELGGLLDRQGHYDEAMAAFLQAKALIRPNAASYLAAQQSVHVRLKEAEADISQAVLARWSESGQGYEPKHRLALLCGHPRSGTTLLEQVLDSHPDMLSAEETTIFFETYLSLKRGFPADALIFSVLDSASPLVVSSAQAGYYQSMERFLAQNVGERLLIDKNPSLTTLVPAAIRIFPEMKFLAALRDPRDVVLSCFMQPLPLNQVSAAYLTLEDTAQEYASVMGFWRTMAARMPNPHLEVRYEDMVEDLESVSRRALEFLGMPWDARVLRFDEHAREKLVRSPTYADVTKPVFKRAVGRWRNYQKYLEPCLATLAPLVKAFGYE